MKKEWTHKNVKITDIRKLKNQKIVITVDIKEINTPLFINERILEDRLKSYYLTESSSFKRDDILNVKWNMYITRGYYIKIKDNEIEEIQKEDLQKYYISFLEIVGDLGTFKSIINPHQTEFRKN